MIKTSYIIQNSKPLVKIVEIARCFIFDLPLPKKACRIVNGYALAHEHSWPLYTFITQRHRGLRAH